MDWKFLHIATFYGPVWVVIAVTFFIYGWAGKEIFAKRRELRNFASAANTEAGFPVIQNPFISPFVSVKTTEIRITTELANLHGRNPSTSSALAHENGRIVSGQGFDPYSVTIGAGPTPIITSPNSSTFARSSGTGRGGHDQTAAQLKAAMEANKAAFSYCKCALLFFVSMLITWVPSSINRVYNFAHPDAVSFPLFYASAFVLPLQGFWNAVIYTATSLPACRALCAQIVDHWMPCHQTKSSSQYPPSISPKRSVGSSEDGVKISFPYAGLKENP